ncbi:hypothetical protein [Streptomyces chattanoogensis]|uniref:hypothetical protein n=1 Tax=Streptomyces chattanoogensis TaxID=66876 RepID=UPI0036BC3B88
MSWWLRVHSVAVSALAIALCLTAGPLLESSAVPLPALLGGLAVSVPLPLIIPLAGACALLYGLDRAPAECEATAVRPVRHWNLALLGGAAVLVTLISAVEALFLGFPLSLGMARNLIGYLGVGLLVRGFIGGQFGTMAAAALPVFCSLIGVGPGGRPYVWAWPLHDAHSAAAAAAAGLLFCAGLVTMARGRQVMRRG